MKVHGAGLEQLEYLGLDHCPAVQLPAVERMVAASCSLRRLSICGLVQRAMAEEDTAARRYSVCDVAARLSSLQALRLTESRTEIAAWSCECVEGAQAQCPVDRLLRPNQGMDPMELCQIHEPPFSEELCEH